MGFSFSGAAPEPGADLHAASSRSTSGKAPSTRSRRCWTGSAARCSASAARSSFRSRRRRSPASATSAASSSRCSIRAGGDINALAAATYGDGRRRQRVAAGCAGLFSSFTANDPQLAVDIDRERALALGLPISEITSALQIYLGLAVRQRLRLQQPRVSRLRAGRQGVPVGPEGARAVLRAHAARARWCRSRTSCGCSETTAPQVISHFNLFRSATINGSAAPGFSSGQALAGDGAAGRDRRCRRA